MKNIFVVLAFFSLQTTFAENAIKISQEEYLNSWKKVAIEQMKIYKIPASITLAQAILESGNGNSDLAQKANNHFGIKCKDWNGDSFYKDDDAKNECFRKYNHAVESYNDHSEFLSTKTRYAKLFQLELTDYKAWARGLKDAGYATNPKYPQLLIDIIERLHLSELDINQEKSTLNLISSSKQTSSLMSNSHQVQLHNNYKIKYIVAQKGDSYYRISKEFQIGMWQLYKYNEFGDKKDYLVAGDIIYLQAKKRKSHSIPSIQLDHDMSIREISQTQGVKLKNLLKKNDLTNPDQLMVKGTRVKLK